MTDSYPRTIIDSLDVSISYREVENKSGIVVICTQRGTVGFGRKRDMHYIGRERTFYTSEAILTTIFYYANRYQVDPRNIAIEIRKVSDVKLMKYLMFYQYGGKTYIMLNQTPDVIQSLLVAMDAVKESDTSNDVPNSQQTIVDFDLLDESVPLSQPVAMPSVAMQNPVAPEMQQSFDPSDSEQTSFSQPVAMQNPVAMQPVVPANQSDETDTIFDANDNFIFENPDFTFDCPDFF